MLQAKLENGNLITLIHLKRNEVHRLKDKKIKFYCPVCHHPVLIKAGPKTIPHFAHYKSEKCSSFDGGEGTYHEQGKWLLYQWLKRQGLSAFLEEYIPDIGQRPDILLVLNKKRIALEYQCARIPLNVIQKRNEGYLSAGITPIWVLGANHFCREASYHFKINAFTQQFIHRFSSNLPPVLYYFCPYTRQFTTLQDLYFTKTNRAIGKMEIKKINEHPFQHLFKYKRFLNHELLYLWQKEKKRFRLRPSKKVYGKELAWYQWLYLKGSHVEYLPSIVYLPISSQYRMKTSLWDWQSRLCLELLKPMSIGKVFSIQTVESLLKKHLQPRTTFPLINSNDHPIKQYFQHLTQIGILCIHSKHTYIKVKDFEKYSNIEEALKGDNVLMDELIRLNKNKIQA
ncbi:competence protein CoiA [Oceanobacillus senegalensis]|uniref:competence protein CoiA n=1 Tax=Oceanobacillus senegalensis TaxID=1936063 RepID=UPI0015C4729B|nr:competence protein CoiA family protein [Oceanobacillus senegalensis]